MERVLVISYTHFANAYARILLAYKKTGKLKKVSYSISNKRFCFAGRIENGILKVSLCKIAIQPERMRVSLNK